MSFRLRKLAIAFIALGPASVLAQFEGLGGEGVRIFEPSYYDEFDPQSALQLVFRTPGFSPQESEGGRGLADVRSNILIDGKRPPPKGQSIRQQLRDMPVNTVQHIELIDAGARLDIDMQGYPQVVNVITVENPPAYYEVTTQVQRSGTGEIDQENEREEEVEATGTFYWNSHEFTMRGQIRDRGYRTPSNFVSIDPANPEQRISSLNRRDQENSNIQLNANLELPGLSSMSITSRFSTFDMLSQPIFLEAQTDPDAITQTGAGGNDQRELSTEYRRPFGDANELMFALVDTTREQQSESSLTDAGLVRSSLNDRENGETAARLFVTQSPSEQITIRTTATTAFNYFEGGFRLFENGVEQAVQGSSNRVEEDRHSIEAEVDWRFTEKWNLRTAVGAEAFDIRSSASSEILKKTDPTGVFSVIYRPQPRTTLTIETNRAVGQLGFDQFLASSSLSSEIVSAGAVAIEPERSLNHSVVYDRRFADRGIMRFTLNRYEVDNPVRTVALSDELTVAQNTSPQTVDSLNASITYPLERFGREDLILGVDGYLASSDTIDPVTNVSRVVSGTTDRFFAVEMRRDPGEGRLAWNFFVSVQKPGENFSVRSISREGRRKQWGSMVEWEVVDRVKVRAELNGPQYQSQYYTFYPAVRSVGLDPSFLASSITRTDRSMSLQVEWRRHDHLEIRAGINSRPKRRFEESLVAFGAPDSAVLAQEIAQSPRIWLRVRAFR